MSAALGRLGLIGRIPPETLPAQQKGADVIGARPLRREVARLDHQIERIDARLERQHHALVAPRRLVDCVDHLKRFIAVLGAVAVGV